MRLSKLVTGHLLFFVGVAGCASSAEPEGAGAAVDESGLDVNVCKKGDELMAVWRPEPDSFAQIHAYGVHTAASGSRISFQIPEPNPDSFASSPTGVSIPFNAAEFAVEARALPIGFEDAWTRPDPPPDTWEGIYNAFKESLAIDPFQVDACQGTVSIAAGVRVNIEEIKGDPEKIAHYCAEGTVSGVHCNLRDGAKVGLSLRALAQTAGFNVTTEPLNLRSGPLPSDPIVTVIPKGAIVRMTGQSQYNSRSIAFGDRTGWAHRDFLERFFGTAVTTEALNFRALPSTQSTINGVIPKGTRVIVRDGSGQFMAVHWEGHGNGYVSGTFLDAPQRHPGSSGQD